MRLCQTQAARILVTCVINLTCGKYHSGAIYEKNAANRRNIFVGFVAVNLNKEVAFKGTCVLSITDCF